MQRYFFSHIINIETLHLGLQTLDLSEQEKSELLHLAHDTLHYAIVNAILAELSHEDKKVFLRQMTMSDHQALWRFLNKKVNGIEEKIKKMAEGVVEELHEDIKESKTKQLKENA